MKKIFFHIGYPKAASTFLQKNIFIQKEFNFINSYEENFSKLGKFIFLTNEEEFKKNYKKYCLFFSKIDDNKINIMSSEAFTNFSSTRDFDLEKIYRRLHIIATSEKINFKFIIIIRNQIDYILSRYAQGHGENSFMSVGEKYKKFFEVKSFFYNDANSAMEKKLFDSFNYFEVISMIKKYFKDDIKIFLFEDLSKNPKYFVTEIFNYLGFDNKKLIKEIDFNKKNPGKKTDSNEYFRNRHPNNIPIEGILNKIAKLLPLKSFFFGLFSRNLKNKIKIISYKLDALLLGHDRIYFNKEDIKKIKEYYNQGNKELFKEIKTNINDYEY